MAHVTTKDRQQTFGTTEETSESSFDDFCEALGLGTAEVRRLLQRTPEQAPDAELRASLGQMLILLRASRTQRERLGKKKGFLKAASLQALGLEAIERIVRVLLSDLVPDFEASKQERGSRRKRLQSTLSALRGSNDVLAEIDEALTVAALAPSSRWLSEARKRIKQGRIGRDEEKRRAAEKRLASIEEDVKKLTDADAEHFRELMGATFLGAPKKAAKVSNRAVIKALTVYRARRPQQDRVEQAVALWASFTGNAPLTAESAIKRLQRAARPAREAKGRADTGARRSQG